MTNNYTFNSDHNIYSDCNIVQPKYNLYHWDHYTEKYINILPVMVWLWKRLPLRVTYTTEPTLHRPAGLCAPRWCATRLCAIQLGCVECHP